MVKRILLAAAAAVVGLGLAGSPAYADHCAGEAKAIKAGMKTLNTKGMTFGSQGDVSSKQLEKQAAMEEMNAKKKKVQKLMKKGNKLCKKKKHEQASVAFRQAREILGIAN